MTIHERARARISPEGHVILPEAVRERLGWTTGAELVVENRTDGVVLRTASAESAPQLPPTRIEDVVGMLGPVDHVITLEEMDEAVAREARRQYARMNDDSDRY